MLPAGFPIKVRAAGLSRFHFPGLEQRCLPISSHLDDEIREAGYRECLDVRLGRIRSVDPEHGPKRGNQDAMAFFINLNDGAVETFFLGRARGRDQANEEEAEADGEKSCTHV